MVGHGPQRPAGGADGLCALTLVLGVDGDAAGFLASVAELVETAPGLNPPDAADQIASFISYQSNAEEGAIDHLVLNPAAMGPDEPWLPKVTKIWARKACCSVCRRWIRTTWLSPWVADRPT